MAEWDLEGQAKSSEKVCHFSDRRGLIAEMCYVALGEQPVFT